ncbi:type VI secretion system lipoprotein TssJ [Trinickia sp. NRRL B-1857]|uniref:type VI secretion system lipoprotein TssJ n=1 Tax=Trinickia sp. NRRL B-1857 TaxID=3162879 RepID=UPI003D2BFFFE
MRHLRIAVPCAAAALLLTSCAYTARDGTQEHAHEQAQAQWTLSASSSVNLDAHARPAPLVVRLYALSARDAFDRATFFELYDHDQAVLGRSALARSVIVLRPGERIRFVEPLDAGTRSLAVVAAYQRIDKAEWRAIVDVNPTASRFVAVAAAFDGERISLSATPQRVPARDEGAIWRFIKPLWQKLSQSMGRTGE